MLNCFSEVKNTMDTAFVFPGQGSQKVGMCAAFLSGFKIGCDTIDEIENAISSRILKLIQEGPIEELTLTQNAQISIFAVSMAVFNVLQNEFGYNVEKNVKYMAGHSLGEYIALCAAGVLSLTDASVLIKKRGELMANAASGNNFCMSAIIGLDLEKIEEITNKYQTGRNICVIANDNSSSQVVISGNISAVDEVSKKALEFGAKKVIRLNTSGPFHSPLMANATIGLDKSISEFVTFNDFKVPVVMNVTAKPLEKSDDIHSMLVRQITSRVRWRESVDFMITNGVTKIVEIGPGKVLTGLNKRSYPDVVFSGIETVTEMEDYVRAE